METYCGNCKKNTEIKNSIVKKTNMKASTYKEKLGAILQLEQFAKVANTRKNAKDLCFKEEERINEALKNLVETGVLNENLSNEMKSKGGQLPKLYGLAKVHKESVPIRPVLSIPGSPYYKLAEKVAKWLSVIPESKINCSTQKTVDQLKNVKLDPEEVMISFDVSSLYTNVPVNEAINDAANLLYSGRYETPPVDKETFIALTKLAVTNVILSSHDGCFRQVDGLAMSSQPAPQLANIWLAKFKETIKDDAKIYERCMDDILRSIKESLVEAKLREINALHRNLKFTLEVEQDVKLPFLDMCIININNELHSKWYQKPSDTGLVMNFHALAPKKYKRSTIQGLVYRIYRASSHWCYFHEGLTKAKEILERNQYPPQFYDSIFKETLQKIILGKENVNVNVESENAPEKPSKVSVFLQCRGHQTDLFVKRLRDSGAPLQSILTMRKWRTVLPSLKSSTKEILRSRVVYKLACPDCNTCYVGQTTRHLLTRFREHKNDKSGPVFKHFQECLGTNRTLKTLRYYTRGQKITTHY